MGNVNFGIAGKGKTDPLMKKIYIGIAVGLLFFICAFYTCSSCTSGPSTVTTVFHCTGKDKDGKPCKGTVSVEHAKKEAPSVPT